MVTKDVYLTKEGFEKLQEEYKELTDHRRQSVASKIKEARELGDISENSEYDAAREEQGFVEGRITELRKLLNNAIIVEDEDSQAGVVAVGSHIKVHLDGEEQRFQLVGAEEADPLSNKISHESPLGQALLGRRVGEKVEVAAPVGKLIYTIIEVA